MVSFVSVCEHVYLQDKQWALSIKVYARGHTEMTDGIRRFYSLTDIKVVKSSYSGRPNYLAWILWLLNVKKTGNKLLTVK
jgi:hypothetical protein